MKKLILILLLLFGCSEKTYSVKLTITTNDISNFNCIWIKVNDDKMHSKVGCDWDGFDECEQIPSGEECLDLNFYEYEITLNSGDKIISRANTMGYTATEDDYLEMKLYVDGSEVASNSQEGDGYAISVLVSYTLD